MSLFSAWTQMTGTEGAKRARSLGKHRQALGCIQSRRIHPALYNSKIPHQGRHITGARPTRCRVRTPPEKNTRQEAQGAGIDCRVNERQSQRNSDVLTCYLDDETAIPVDTGSRKGDPRRERPIAELNKEVFRTVWAHQQENTYCNMSKP